MTADFGQKKPAHLRRSVQERSTKIVLKNSHQSIPLGSRLWLFHPILASAKTQGNEPKCNHLLRFTFTVTDLKFSAKKTCASAQVGAIKWPSLRGSTSPINTSGMIRVSIARINPPALIRNSQSQSVTKGLNYPFSFSIARDVLCNFFSPRTTLHHICFNLHALNLEQHWLFRNTKRV